MEWDHNKPLQPGPKLTDSCDRVSCSETFLERLLLLLFWGLNQPYNGLWDLCHCWVTAVKLGGRQRRIATRTHCSIYTVANQRWSIDHKETKQKKRERNTANKELPLQHIELCFMKKCWETLLGVRVDNPFSGEIPYPDISLQLHLLLFWGTCKIVFFFFHRNYFTSSTATPYRIHCFHGNIWAVEEKKKDGRRER